MGRGFRRKSVVLVLGAGMLLLGGRPLNGAEPRDERNVNRAVDEQCDAGVPLKPGERITLLTSLRISTAGKLLVESFQSQYSDLTRLAIHWNSTSYSQITGGETSRAPASLKDGEGPLGQGICVHLARKLPDIEHIADLAHELTHATRLSRKVLRGDVATATEFVSERLTGPGGEADAFISECNVKHELLERWDAFCSTYVSKNEMSRERVIRDLYNGVLSASLTGETYPILLERQFRMLQQRKSEASGRYSGLENKR